LAHRFRGFSPWFVCNIALDLCETAQYGGSSWWRKLLTSWQPESETELETEVELEMEIEIDR
jgi:hypothetical protein